MGFHVLLQGIVPTQGSNLCLLYWQADSLPLSHQGSHLIHTTTLFSWSYDSYSAEGNGNPLQYSCLENPLCRGAWWAAVHGVAQSQSRLKRLSMHACIGEGNGNALQCSCLENPRDRGARWAAVYGVAQSWTRLKRLSSSMTLIAI